MRLQPVHQDTPQVSRRRMPSSPMAELAPALHQPTRPPANLPKPLDAWRPRHGGRRVLFVIAVDITRSTYHVSCNALHGRENIPSFSFALLLEVEGHVAHAPRTHGVDFALEGGLATKTNTDREELHAIRLSGAAWWQGHSGLSSLRTSREALRNPSSHVSTYMECGVV
eukprot:scaffold197683_cov31-Tisochrysis_lutea.AAC.7